MRRLVPLLAMALVGCGGVSVTRNPDPVDISGQVTLAGRPVTDVVFNLQPTGAGAQAIIPVKDGEFKGTVTPGRYTYYITEGASKPAFQSIPSKFREGAMDRQIDVAAGSKLEIALD